MGRQPSLISLPYLLTGLDGFDAQSAEIAWRIMQIQQRRHSLRVSAPPISTDYAEPAPDYASAWPGQPQSAFFAPQQCHPEQTAITLPAPPSPGTPGSAQQLERSAAPAGPDAAGPGQGLAVRVKSQPQASTTLLTAIPTRSCWKAWPTFPGADAVSGLPEPCPSTSSSAGATP
ncbi:DUF3131 domain-containing protein [Klebsiella variicola subsp. variicola]|nr:DUF3131 domain-containing protein [Klebsiella variicola subsp. variicola]